MPFRRWFGYHRRPALDPMSCDYVLLGDGMSKIGQGMRLTCEVPTVYGDFCSYQTTSDVAPTPLPLIKT